jgi:ADP-ribose pyrophosphatase YjhB (NUDIX family)
MAGGVAAVRGKERTKRRAHLSNRMRWRPPQTIRAIAVALVYRGTDVLVMAVKDDSGSIKGWRPLGGAIEFGESAEEALAREFLEEIGQPIRCIKQLCVLENLYSHEGTRGHEIVFAFEAELVGSDFHSNAGFSFFDGGVTNDVAWRPVHEFAEGVARLFPEKLIGYLA